MPENFSTPNRRSAGQVLATWEPDQRWHYPVIAGALAYTVSWIPVLGHLPSWIMLGIGFVLIVAGGVLARRAYPIHVYGPGQHKSAIHLSWSAALFASAWWVYAGIVGPASKTAIALLAVGTIVWGVWFAIMLHTAPKAQERTEHEDEERQEQFVETSVRDAWMEILRRVGYPAETCSIVSINDTDSGYAIGVIPNINSLSSFSAFKTKAKDLAATAAFVLAEHGETIGDEDIRLESTSAAHVHLIHVRTVHTLQGKVAYEIEPGPVSCRNPVHIAQYETGGPVRVSVHDTHGGTVGATGSGKSVFGNVLIGRCTEPEDMITCVVASSKLVPLVYPWLRPWLDGRSARPVFGFVAGQDVHQALQGLAWAYQLVRAYNDRNAGKSKRTPTKADPAVKIIIEEASALMRRTETITVNGQEMTASAIVNAIAEAGRSACVTVELFTQAALIEALGRWGSTMQRNLTRRTCLRTMNQYDGTATLVGMRGDVDTSRLRDNTMLVQDSIDKPQAVPAKSLYLEEDGVHPVSIHNERTRPEFPEWVVQLLGPEFRSRWDARNHPELVRAAKEDGLSWPGAPASSGGSPAAPVAGKGQDGAPRVASLPIPSLPDNADDVFAAMIADLERELSPTNQTSVAAMDGLPNVNDAISDLNAITERTNSPTYQLLRTIVTELKHPAAPKDFVSTRQLVKVLGRVDKNATEDEIKRATEALGTELATGVPGLTTVRKRVAGDVRRGYQVERLILALKCLAKGQQLPPPDAAETE